MSHAAQRPLPPSLAPDVSNPGEVATEAGVVHPLVAALDNLMRAPETVTVGELARLLGSISAEMRNYDPAMPAMYAAEHGAVELNHDEIDALAALLQEIDFAGVSVV